MPTKLFVLRLCVVLSCLGFHSALATQETDKPNLLFIAVDDLNNMVGFLKGHPGTKTPHMDALAKRGVVFANAHCAAPICAPSRAALLTGLSPSLTGVYLNQDDWRKFEIARTATTIPECFQAAGYKTVGGGKLYHAYSFNERAYTGYFDPQPWDEYFPSKERQMPTEIKPPKWPVNSSKKFYNGYFDWSPLQIDEAEMADSKVVAWAEEQLSREHDKPAVFVRRDLPTARALVDARDIF